MTTSPLPGSYSARLGYEQAQSGLSSQQKLLINVLIVALLTWYAALGVATYDAYRYAAEHLAACPAGSTAAPCGPAPLDGFLQDAITGLGTAFTAALGILLGINVAWANAQRQGAAPPTRERQYLKAAWIGAGLFVLSLALIIGARLAFSLQGYALFWPTTLGNLMQTILLIIIAAVGGVTASAVTSGEERHRDGAEPLAADDRGAVSTGPSGEKRSSRDGEPHSPAASGLQDRPRAGERGQVSSPTTSSGAAASIAGTPPVPDVPAAPGSPS